MFNARAVPTLRAIASRMPAQPAGTFSRTFASTHLAQSSDGHSADSYFKDVDSEPPADSTVHRVDSGSEAVQRPYDGDSSRAVQSARTSARGADHPRRPDAASIRSSVCNPSRTVPGVFAKAENASIMPRAILAR